MTGPRVELRPLDAPLLERLVVAAVDGARPAQVAPLSGADDPSPQAPVDHWTDARIDAFRAWHRAASLAPGGGQRTFAVLLAEPAVPAGEGRGGTAAAADADAGGDGADGEPADGEPADGEVIGAARLADVPGEAGTVEAGLWLSRHHRGRGHGRTVLRLLREAARDAGAHRLFASTTAGNAAARRLLVTELGAHTAPGAATLTARDQLSPAAALLGRASGPGEAPSPAWREQPGSPGPLVLRWLREAADAGVAALQAATLATVDEEGAPDARVLVLRDVSPDGAAWSFATDSGSTKGRQLAARPAAALTLHWPEQARQVRVRGEVTAGTRDDAAAEFRTRSPAARIAAHTGHQSEPLASDQAYRQAAEAARRLVAADPDAVPPGHTVYTLHAREVEFWQGAPDRFHQRLHYRRTADGWDARRLWP
ncbi:pyridoxal 5'-phosphate synthase [Streptomyces bohaiensis]|uniref:pyridoxal 5'-phosphate synthase n=1 Tax=Streptomyces bohaiensis TaxID=1431344 RepID=UPI003B829FD1